MEQQQWERISEILDNVLDLEAENRVTYIEEACKGDRQLKQAVHELLESIEQSNTKGFLEGSEAYPSELAVDFSKNEPAGSALTGKTVGNYNILKLIGHGGMGSVFLTERTDGAYDKKVALKLLRRGMDTPSNIARFKRERNILATLDHPNIARLLDGGVTEDGLPYLVMEYIDGTPLLEYCDNHQLSIEKRLELFKSVCRAVQHAHRNATIHRDLKPSNIFVTEDGTVKVLDFGIAKLLENNEPDTSFFQTRTGARILTIGYAAPEQFENKSITTATDSYTLGILLYQLLAGIHPFDAEKKDLSGFENMILTQAPDKPSEKFIKLPESEKAEIAAQRDAAPSAIVQALKGDLDAILMKALRTEPESRYGSVELLLEDFNRYNRSLPLIAQSDTIRYRVGKFIRRNRKAVMGGLIILIAVIGFGSYHFERITEERNIAKTEAQKAQSVKNFLINVFRSSNPRSASFGGRDLSAEQLLLSEENKITNELNDQPDVYVEVSMAIGDALKSIDAFEEAEKSYKKALAKSPETTQTIENKLRTNVKLGWLHTDWRESQKQAHQHALEAQKLLKRIENPSAALEASVFSLLGRILSVREKRDLGNSYFEKADSIYVNAGLENTYDYIKMLTGYGRALIYVSDFQKSAEVLVKSNKLHRQKYRTPTLTIAENYKFLAWANRELGNFKKSNNYFKKSTNLKRKLIGGQTVKTALSMYHLARNYTLSGDFEKSEELAQKVLNIYQKGLQPPNNYIQLAKNYLAIAKYNQAKFSEAEQLFKQIIEKRSKMFGADHISFANTGEHLAIVYTKTGHYEKAISLLKKCIRINKRELGAQSRGVAVNWLKLADAYRAKGDYKTAQKYFRQVESIFKTELPENHFRWAEFNVKLAKLKRDMDQSQEAQKYFERAYDLYLDLFGEDSNRTKQAKSYLEQISEALKNCNAW